MSEKKILLCGLPHSGKTTFLAALWYLVFHMEIPTALTLRSLPEKRDYLNEISQKWAKFIEIERTKTVKEISIPLIFNATDVNLCVPDMDGETWKLIWSSRSCDPHTAEWINNASGILLFLHADKIRPPLDIYTLNEMAEQCEQPPSGIVVDNNAEDNNKIAQIPWDPEKSPTQVVLVDILQTLTMPPIGGNGRRLAVIISAWDKAEATGHAPEEYLRIHTPLLHQFLRCSGLFSKIKYYGVSALGGDIEEVRSKSEDMPSVRIKVVEEGQTTCHDLTVPIQWLMEE